MINILDMIYQHTSLSDLNQNCRNAINTLKYYSFYKITTDDNLLPYAERIFYHYPIIAKMPWFGQEISFFPSIWYSAVI